MTINKKIRAFTLSEMLVTLALTSILAALAYSTLNQIQKIFYQYNTQSLFITQFNELEKRLSNLNTNSTSIVMKNDKVIDFKTDSSSVRLEFLEKTILIKHALVTDTFKLENKALKFSYLKLPSEVPVQLINAIEFDIFMQNQKFHISFNKDYDASSIIKLTRDLIKQDEFN